jgi:hypothetical protein
MEETIEWSLILRHQGGAVAVHTQQASSTTVSTGKRENVTVRQPTVENHRKKKYENILSTTAPRQWCCCSYGSFDLHQVVVTENYCYIQIQVF